MDGRTGCKQAKGGGHAGQGIAGHHSRTGQDKAGTGAGEAEAEGEPIWYDLVANVVHEAVRAKEDVADSGEERKTWKVQLRDKATDEWVVCQDLFVEKTQKELLYLGESYLQIWERRRTPPQSTKGKGKASA